MTVSDHFIRVVVKSPECLNSQAEERVTASPCRDRYDWSCRARMQVLFAFLVHLDVAEERRRVKDSDARKTHREVHVLHQVE